MRAAVIENGLVSTIVDVPSLDAFGESVKLVEAPEWVVSGATWDGEVFTNPTPPPPTPEQIMSRLSARVQRWLDEQARSLGYDDIKSAVSYADEPAVPQFQQEGQALRRLRSLAWARYQEIQAQVQAGRRPIPTEAELIAEMEVLK